MKNLIAFIVLFTVISKVRSLNSVWGWECKDQQCQKTLITATTTNTALSLSACRFECNQYAGIWPKPTGNFSASSLTQISIENIKISSLNSSEASYNLFQAASNIFLEQVRGLTVDKSYNQSGKSVSITFTIEDTSVVKLALDGNENYTLTISQSDDEATIAVNITAGNFFGARHALETLAQLIVYDDLRDEVLMASNASIVDGPAFKWRGLVLDTSRNFVDLATLKRTVNAMGASKLNTFHWHFTDSASFPYVSKSRPELSQYGAYSPNKVYTAKDVSSLIEYALTRGVRVIPELDAPAHVGEGWQNTGLVTCFNWQPWTSYCNEAPCGQLDPTQDAVYDVLEDLYGDMLEQFDPVVFHMGGDEVNKNCWNATQNITDWMTEQGWGRTSDDFINLWNYFQKEALARLYKKSGKEIPVILWSSDLTTQENITENLPVDKYIIQIWTTADDSQVTDLLKKNYTLIMSNYDALYLDCGFASWVSTGNNWCSPYKGWQEVYENRLNIIGEDRRSQILGSEAALWTEQVDSTSVDSRLWPRASALGEVLWSAPETSWSEAEDRILIHRERLVFLGVNSDSLEPEWCLQNQGNCPA